MEAGTERTGRTERLDPEEPDDLEDFDDQGDAEAYWRRRVYVLAGGIALIGLVAWACSGSDRDAGHKQSAARVRDAAATVSPAAALPAAVPTPTLAVTVTVTATPAVPVEKKRAGDQCDAADVVVGVTPNGTVFKSRQHPTFALSVVNTGRRACTVDVGPKALPIRISSGSDHVWSSERCVDRAGPSLQLLRRGVPYLATLDWDRRRCDGDTRAAPGTYVIAVGAPGIRTQREVFRLR
jgi:hypothetical protein